MSLTRRKFLRSSTGLLLALPLLESLSSDTVQAGENTAPKRVLWWLTPNGHNMDDWAIAKEGTGYALSPILEPFAAYTDKMTVVSGLRNYGCGSSQYGDFNEGHSGYGIFLSCTGTTSQTYNATTVDQRLAQEIGKENVFPSLQLGMTGSGSTIKKALSWAGPESPLPTVSSPAALFARLFGSGEALTPEEMTQRRKLRLSVLDGVLDDLGHLDARLPHRDRLKLDQYTTSLRELEIQINKAGSVVCDPGDAPGTTIGFPDKLDQMCAVMALALQCDLSRIMSFALGLAGTNMTYHFADVPEAHHGLSHHGQDPEKLAKLTKLGRWQSEAFANSLLARLENTLDFDGKTLLDNTIIVYGSTMGDGAYHDNFDLPVVLFGGTDSFKHGHHLVATDKPLADLHLAVSQAAGGTLSTLGEAGTGPLAGLT